MRWLVCWLAILSASCSSAEPDSGAVVSAGLRRFEEVATFLPSGMSSYWFTDRSVVSPAHRTSANFEDVRMQARCGKDFRPPKAIGAGPHTFVSVDDYGQGAAPAAAPALPNHDIAPTDPLDGTKVWIHTEPTNGLQSWSTIVDRRFHVAASSRELLRAALGRTATLADNLSFLPDLSVVDERAFGVVACRLRPRSGSKFAGPTPTDVVLAQVDADAGVLEILSPTAQPEVVDYYAARAARVDLGDRAPYVAASIHLPADADFLAREFWLEQAQLYGLHLFV
jgi:hypothetical protein